MGTSARDTGSQLVHFLRKRFNVGGAGGLVTTVSQNLGVLPANAIPTEGGVYVSSNLSGTTNVLDVGYAADSLSTSDVNAYATALALPITTGGAPIAFDEMTTITAAMRSVPTTVTVTFTGTATTGVFDVAMQYLVNR